MNASPIPLLVTGGHRTGTTWVGKMLAAGGEAAYISEPLNIWHRPGVLRVPTRHWYTYICAENEDRYLPALKEMLAFRYHLWDEIRALRSVKDFLRMGRDFSIFWGGRLFGKRPLIKDPFAVFSIPWFIQRLGCQVVVTLRHPAAFVSSLKRLSWPFAFADLLNQPLLMRDRLSAYRREMESVPPNNIIAQGSLLWKMIYRCVADDRQRWPQIILVRHEDLSLEPLGGFQALYQSLGLQFNRRARRAILASSDAANPAEISRRSAHSVRVNSRANLDHWKRRLSPDEIEQVRRITSDVAAEFYPPQSWD